MGLFLRFVILLLSLSSTAAAQWWDLPFLMGDALTRGSEKKVVLTFEQRIRTESRMDPNFGIGVGHAEALLRTRVGLTVRPLPWLKLSGMLQDSRAPGYGPGAPTNVRSPFGLHEAYIELTPGAFDIEAGRSMIHYGEGIIIGTPQWGNTSRTYDHAIMGYRWRGLKAEFLVVSPVKLRIDDFARPVLGERAWGTYNFMPNVWRKTEVQFYILRHDVNRTAGFTGGSALLGTDRFATNTFGARWSGPVFGASRFSFEGVLQNGRIGGVAHRAGAGHATFGRRYEVLGGRTLDLYTEYNYATGTDDPRNPSQVNTFDQVFAAHHDRYGHQDLFGWRNIHALRGLATLGLTRRLNLNLMYDDFWLASARDALYNGIGLPIVRSPNGTAGRHVGREADIFATLKLQHSLFGLGFGHLFTGEFLRATTPGRSPQYMYIFHTYSF